MYELERRLTYRPTRLTRRELAALEQEEIVAKARREAAVQAAAEEMALREQLRQAQSQFRLNGVYDLANYATYRATGLDRAITAQDRDNPHLEPIHRGFAGTAALVADLIIYQYGTGR
jgi:hypothetical protein